MESTRAFRVTVYRDTNKATYLDEYESSLAAIIALLPNLSEEENRALRQLLTDTGSDDIPLPSSRGKDSA